MKLLYALIASIIVSLVSFVGILVVLIKENLLEKIKIVLIALGAGGLIGGAFVHLLPEALEKSGDPDVSLLFLLMGFVLFFFLERFLFWRHCHKGKCDIHVFTYLNLIGDGVHNFIDGLIIGGAFFVDIHFGIITTAAITMHEIPQELGDFGVLVYGGYSVKKALILNFFTALTAIAGTFFGYFFSNSNELFLMGLLPFAAGGFIYVAACDLIPALHKEQDKRISLLNMAMFLIGIFLMYGTKIVFGH